MTAQFPSDIVKSIRLTDGRVIVLLNHETLRAEDAKSNIWCLDPAGQVLWKIDAFNKPAGPGWNAWVGVEWNDERRQLTANNAAGVDAEVSLQTGLLTSIVQAR